MSMFYLQNSRTHFRDLELLVLFIFIAFCLKEKELDTTTFSNGYLNFIELRQLFGTLFAIETTKRFS